MRVRSAFNSAILFAVCGLLIVVTVNAATAAATADGPPRDDPRCSTSLSVVLENDGGDGNFTYDGVVYPARLRWTDGNLTYGCICRQRRCIRKCCHNDEVIRRESLKGSLCEKIPQTDLATDSPAKTPALRLTKEQLTEEIRDIGELSERFLLIGMEGNVCPDSVPIVDFNVKEEEGEENIVLYANGDLFIESLDKVVSPSDYCFDWTMTLDKVGILVCYTSKEEQSTVVHMVGIIISIPFLIATFLVYAITPELRNLYGKTLMCYVICLITAYILLGLVNYVYISLYTFLCVVTAFFIHFSFLASFFWLNVMCFDIWWTFGGFRSLQGSVRQRERKKFIMYSIYAWGCASILTIVCAIMDFVPTVPDTFIKPEFGKTRCWYRTEEGKAIYFYGPMGLTIICNICLFISTALKIVRHKKDTAHHLRSSESRRHDDNKQWFILYLKLFIVMGINWSMEIISWLFKDAPPYVWYLTDLTNTLQGLTIFIIFVWKDKIKKLLLKRFGCQERGLFSRNSTRSGCHSTASRTCTTTSGVSLQEKISPYVQTNCRTKNSFDETDCP